MSAENNIIDGLKAGQEAAYQHLYTHHYKALCVFANAYTDSMVASEMIVSDVIFAIWESRAALNIHTSLRNYLMRAVRNRCLNYIAQSERQSAMRQHVEEEIDAACVHYEDSLDNPLTRLIEKELDGEINRAIEALPAKTRDIFCLSRFDNMKYEEIARRMDVSVDVVKYHIKSALAQLKTVLKDYIT
jgi:RNA polymerase sigma-70 factor (ECF subfamily)